jgi:hypothetical protein
MATYKRITDVQVVEKNDNMNVLVEDAGTLKKIPAAQVGGGGSIGGIFVLEEGGSANYTTNMTYDELRNALINNEIIWGVYRQNSIENYRGFDFIADFDIQSSSILLTTNHALEHMSGHADYYEFNSDGTIYFVPANGLGGGMGGDY